MEEHKTPSFLIDEAIKLVEVYDQNKKQLKHAFKSKQEKLNDLKKQIVQLKCETTAAKKDYVAARKIYQDKASALLSLHQVDFKVHRKFKFGGTKMANIKARFEKEAKAQKKKDDEFRLEATFANRILEEESIQGMYSSSD